MSTTTYAIGLGGNRRTRYGDPAATLAAALDAIGGIMAVSRIRSTAPLGPSIRRFANAAVLIATDESPPELLARLKRIERRFGRRPGRRWGARALDLDILLWSGGIWADPGLRVPHAALPMRAFVLAPLAEIAPEWRDPTSGLTMRHLSARLTARHRRPRARCIDGGGP
ncbi:2-amino-4-hydroxy-6-hydroxymethyldihydropteridine diphosphokinase [Sphingomonas sp. CROZ-RG-20F-R02-07]|uniref:2-amino-4-hydroxy-6- hydroxymethyldihydropteridine diphosphokinase n=1 Tax=Sphingomonas sp. CROZ-RG-20F-R02-07 TaxID=2914832 RepID=UPI001F563F99